MRKVQEILDAGTKTLEMTVMLLRTCRRQVSFLSETRPLAPMHPTPAIRDSTDHKLYKCNLP
jgi:hypothetical protein